MIQTLLAALLSLILLAGCQSTPQREAQAQAQARWHEVRARIKYQLAADQFHGGQVDAAVESLDEALALNPKQSDFHLLRSRIHLEKSDLPAARREADIARQYAPDSAEAFYQSGVVAERSGNPYEALTFYSRARELEPAAVDYLLSEAECLVSTGRVNPARQVVLEYGQAYGHDGTLDALLAEIDLLRGDEVSAARWYGSALRHLGGSAPALEEEYGRLLVHLGRYAEAVAVLQPLVDRDRDVPGSVVRALANAYQAVGAAARTVNLLSLHTRAHPQDATAWRILGRAAIEMGDDALVYRCIARLDELVPDDERLHILRAAAAWQRGDQDAAQLNAARALAVNPDDAFAHLLLGQVLNSRRDPEHARTHFETALRLDPSCTAARTALEALAPDAAPASSAAARQPPAVDQPT